jgi:hypothetical protein
MLSKYIIIYKIEVSLSLNIKLANNLTDISIDERSNYLIKSQMSNKKNEEYFNELSVHFLVLVLNIFFTDDLFGKDESEIKLEFQIQINLWIMMIKLSDFFINISTFFLDFIIRSEIIMLTEDIS